MKINVCEGHAGEQYKMHCCACELKQAHIEIARLRASNSALEIQVEQWQLAVPVADSSGDPVDDPERAGAFVTKQFDKLDQLGVALAAKDAEIAKLRSAITACRNDYRMRASGASPVMQESPFVMLELCEKALEEK